MRATTLSGGRQIAQPTLWKKKIAWWFGQYHTGVYIDVCVWGGVLARIWVLITLFHVINPGSDVSKDATPLPRNARRQDLRHSDSFNKCYWL